MTKIIRYLLIMSLCMNNLLCFSNDVLPQNYTSNNINPYQTRESWFKFVRTDITKLPQPKFYQPEKMKKTFQTSKYENVLSRMEREWFGVESKNCSDIERIEKLEERVLGTIQEGNIKHRLVLLQKAFDAKKTMKQQNYTKNMFSGVPTSIPMNVDELLEN